MAANLTSSFVRGLADYTAICGMQDFLKHVLQCELQDSRIEGRLDLTEIAGIEVRDRITGPQAIGDIVGLGSSFQPLGFTEPECSRDRYVELPCSRTLNTPRGHISVEKIGASLTALFGKMNGHWQLFDTQAGADQ
ncbi:MAG TPA: hypothetical protein VGK77_23115 [Candidatus Binatia bacterium]|jgi:hypothetical protein